MGWEEGKGLGRDNKGIVKHIWTKKRNDQVGLGGEVGNDWGAHSIQTNTYNSLLSKLAVITNNSDDSGSGSDSDEDVKSKTKKTSSKSKKDRKHAEPDSDEEVKGKKGKKKRPKKVESSSDSDSSDEDVSKAASASCDDYGGGSRKAGRSYAAAAVKESKQVKSSVTAMRYAYKRTHMNKTKDVSSYSATDLSQILGFSVAPKEEDKALLQRDGVKKYGKAHGARSKANDSSESDDESDEEAAGSKKRKGQVGGKADQKGGIVLGSSKRKPMALPEPSTLTGVLLHMFSHGGFLSGESKQKEQDWQFDEATQEKIAVDAHNSKVTGKKGLGFDNDRPTKLGKDYAGSKKTFEDSDDEGEGARKKEAEGSKADAVDESEDDARKRRKAEKKARKKAKAEAEAAAEEASKGKDKKRKKKAREEEEELARGEGGEESGGKAKKKKPKKQKSE